MDDTAWLRAALRFTLQATASTDAVQTAAGGDLVDPDDPGKDPRFRKLVDAILFGRRFLKTYNLVLLGVLLVFTAWHWGEKMALHRRMRRMRGSEDAEAWSSSSSTVGEGGEATMQKDDERSALLAERGARRKPVGFFRKKPYYVLKATLQYQPPPIPLVNKTLPTNATSLLVLGWLGLIVFYNVYRMPLSFFYLFVFADRCGIIFISNLPLLYLLAAKNQPIKLLTGHSYESLNIFHRRVGEVMCFEAFLHFAGMFAVWFGLLRHIGFSLAKFIFNRVVLLGLAAFVAYEIIYFSSLGSFRRRWYEVFLATHVILQVAGLVFLWFHHYTSRPYVGVSLAIFLVDRLVYRMCAKSSTHTASLTVLDDGETLLLSANWNIVSKSSTWRKNMRNGWRPNQHIFLSVPALGATHVLQSHPFTIFSAAPTSSNNHAFFSLLIRPQSPHSFTHALLTHALTHSTATIRLDGPYGSPHALDMLRASDAAIIIAGGSGVAVAYPLLYSLLAPDADAPAPRRKVKFLWITHAPLHALWVPQDKLDELREWGLEVLVAPPTGVVGRPDVKGILEGWVDEGGRTAVVVSGPEGLVRGVRNGVAGMVGTGLDVTCCVEKFGW